MSHKLPPEQLESVKETFHKIDEDGDGKLKSSELALFFELFGVQQTEEELKQIIEEIDENKNGFVDFEEFCEIINQVNTELENAILNSKN